MCQIIIKFDLESIKQKQTQRSLINKDRKNGLYSCTIIKQSIVDPCWIISLHFQIQHSVICYSFYHWRVGVYELQIFNLSRKNLLQLRHNIAVSGNCDVTDFIGNFLHIFHFF